MSKLKQFCKQLGILSLISIFVASSIVSSAQALGGKYDESFYSGNDILYYNPNACSSTGTAAPAVTPTTTGSGVYSLAIKNPESRQYHGDDYSPRQSGISVGNDGYSKQNSIDGGIKYAHQHGYGSIDLDLNRSTDGVYFAIHRSDATGKSWAAVDRHNNTRKFKIAKLQDLLSAAAKYNVQTNIELKVWGGNHKVWSEADMIAIANMANSAGAKATIKGDGNTKNISDALHIAQTHGFWVRTVLNTGRGNGWVPRKWYPPSTGGSATATPASNTPVACCPTSGTATTASASVEGKDGEEKAWKFLTGIDPHTKQPRLSAEQAAGVMGSLKVESQFDPKAKNGSNYTGISQWDTGGRWASLVKWAKSKGLDQWSFDTQIQYTYKEATDRKNIVGIKKYTDVPHTAWYWGRYFEVAIIGGSSSDTPLTNVQALKERTQAAQSFFNKYKGTAGSSISSVSSSSSCASDASLSGNASCSNVDAKPPDDFERTTFPGTSEKTDKRTLYLVNVANDCLKQLGEKPVTVLQGSYCAGSCAGASGSSHNKGATLDIRTRDRGGKDKIMKLLKVLREVGFAAWYRDGGDNPSFAGNEHIHAVAVGAPLTGPNAPGSPDQLILYCIGGDGLRGGQKDRQLAIIGRPLPKWAENVKPDCKSQIVRSV